MAMTLHEVQTMFDQLGIKYEQKGLSRLLFAFKTSTYLSPEGDPGVMLVLQLDEDGEYLKLFAPEAFKLQGAHSDAFLRACMMIQWQTKMVQFEFDATDGEIRPIVEFPLEDGKVTLKQLNRCMGAIVGILEEYYPVLRKAVDSGTIDFGNEANAGVLEILARGSRMPAR